jgi:uncharacterized membrane protein
MKFGWIAAALIAVAALATGCITYLCMRESLPAGAAQDDALLWIRHEFRLSPEQMAQIEARHAAYQVVCDEHCRLVREARATIATLHATTTDAASMAAAHARAEELDLLCKTSLEAHLREIAGVIGGDAGARYLATVLPRIAAFDHSGTPQVDLESSADPHAGHHAHH